MRKIIVECVPRWLVGATVALIVVQCRGMHDPVDVHAVDVAVLWVASLTAVCYWLLAASSPIATKKIAAEATIAIVATVLVMVNIAWVFYPYP